MKRWRKIICVLLSVALLNGQIVWAEQAEDVQSADPFWFSHSFDELEEQTISSSGGAWSDLIFATTPGSTEEPTSEPTEEPTPGPTENPDAEVSALVEDAELVPSSPLFHLNSDVAIGDSAYYNNGGIAPVTVQDAGGNNVLKLHRSGDDLRFWKWADTYDSQITTTGVTFQFNYYAAAQQSDGNHSGVLVYTRDQETANEVNFFSLRVNPNDTSEVEVRKGGKNGVLLATFSTAQWHTIAVTVNKETADSTDFSYVLYIDGVEKASDSITLSSSVMSFFGFRTDNWWCSTNGDSSELAYLDNLYAYTGDALTKEITTAEPTEEVSEEPIQGKPNPTEAPQYGWFYNDAGSNNVNVTREIVMDGERNSKVLKLTKNYPFTESFKLFRWLDDCNTSGEETFTFEMDINVTSFYQNWTFGVNDYDLVDVHAHGQGNIYDVYGVNRTQNGTKLIENQWSKIAIQIDKDTTGATNGTYSAFLNGQCIMADVEMPFDTATTNMNRFVFKSNAGSSSSLYVDNFRAYAGEYQPFWFYHTFEELSVGDLPNTGGGMGLAAPYDLFYNDAGSGLEEQVRSIAVEDGNQFLKLTKGSGLSSGQEFKIFRWTDDQLGRISVDDAEVFTYELKIRLDQFAQGWEFGINDIPFVSIPANNNGHIQGATFSWGTLLANEWANLAIEVNRKNETYNVYLNGQCIRTNVSLPAALQGDTEEIRFFSIKTITGTEGSGELSIDDFCAYEGWYMGTIGEGNNLGRLWFYNDFESLPAESIKRGGYLGLPAPYDTWYGDAGFDQDYTSCDIVSDGDNGNVLSLTKAATTGSGDIIKLYRYTGDHTNIPGRNVDESEVFTYAFDFSISSFSQDWVFGFNGHDLVRIKDNILGDGGSILQSNASGGGTQIGTLSDNHWANLAIEVHKDLTGQSNGTYSVYLNHVALQTNIEMPIDPSSIDYFVIKSDYQTSEADSTFKLDNFSGYPYAYQPYWINDDYNDLESGTQNAYGLWGNTEPYNTYYNDYGWGTDDATLEFAPENNHGQVVKIHKSADIAQNQAVKIYRGLSTLDNLYYGMNYKNQSVYTFEFDAKIDGLGHNWIFGIDNADLITIPSNNSNSDPNDFDYVDTLEVYGAWNVLSDGSIREGEWATFAIEIMRSRGTYNVYMNQIKILADVDLPENLQDNISYFEIKSNWRHSGDATLSFDNFKFYAGKYTKEVSLQESQNVWFANNYENLELGDYSGSDSFDWGDSYSTYEKYWGFGSNYAECKILKDYERDSRVLALTKKANAAQNDSLMLRRNFSVDMVPTMSATSIFTYEVDICIDDFGHNWMLGFDEQEDFLVIPIDVENDHSMLKIGNQEGGRVDKNKWTHIAIEVNRANGTYSVYQDRVLIFEDVSIPQGADHFNYFMLKSNYRHGVNDSTLRVDNMMAYPNAYQPYWIENTYDELANPLPQTSHQLWTSEGAYQAYYNDVGWGTDDADMELVEETGRGNVLKINKYGTIGQNETVRLIRYMDDNKNDNLNISAKTEPVFTYEWDFKISNFTHNWMFGFGEHDLITIPNSSQNYGIVNGNSTDGRIAADAWQTIAVTLNTEKGTALIYLNGELIDKKENYTINDYRNFFYMSSNYNQGSQDSSLTVDNLKIYNGYYSNSSGLATKIFTDSPVQGILNFRFDNDYFVFTPSKSGEYLIQMSGLNGIQGVLCDSNEVPIAINVMNGASGDYLFRTQLEAGQTYYIAVSSETHALGQYHLIVLLPTSSDVDIVNGNAHVSGDLSTFGGQKAVELRLYDSNDSLLSSQNVVTNNDGMLDATFDVNLASDEYRVVILVDEEEYEQHSITIEDVHTQTVGVNSGEHYSIPIAVLNANNLRNIEFSFQYDASVFSLYDVCDATEIIEQFTGIMEDANVNICRLDQGYVVFRSTLLDNSSWSGIVNTIKLQAVETTTTSINCFVYTVQSEVCGVSE